MAKRCQQSGRLSNKLCFLALMLICDTTTFFVSITFYSSCPTDPSEVKQFESTEYHPDLPPEYLRFTSAQSLPFGFDSQFDSDTMYPPVGAVCTSFPEELAKYMSYNVNGSCPDDEILAQKLLLKGCEPLPRSRCRPVAQTEYMGPKPISRLSVKSIQVKLMSLTDILVSPHGAQLTNMFLMDRNSSVMEFIPKGWLKLAGWGQYVYRSIATSSGMRHQGDWRDPTGDPCPYPEDDPRCMSIFKHSRIGHNEMYFAEWARKVIREVKARKAEASSSVGCKC